MTIFVDTNIPIYSSGREHPLQEPSRAVLRLVSSRPQSFVTDAEVLQELLHRYLALRIWPEGGAQVRDFAEVMRGRIQPLLAADVEAAVELASDGRQLSARDLIHLAVMRRLGVTAHRHGRPRLRTRTRYRAP